MHERSFSREAVLRALLTQSTTRSTRAPWSMPPGATCRRKLCRPLPCYNHSALMATQPPQLARRVSRRSRSARSWSKCLTASNSIGVEMLFVIESPRVVLFGNLLSDEECGLLIRLSRDKLQRSSVVNASTGAYDVHPHRTSCGTYFKRGENELLQRIEKRIAELVDCPLEQGEPIQVLHYEPGGEYKPHYDYFDPSIRKQGSAGAGRPTHCNADHVSERCASRRINGLPRNRARRAAAQRSCRVLCLLR